VEDCRRRYGVCYGVLSKVWNASDFPSQKGRRESHCSDCMPKMWVQETGETPRRCCCQAHKTFTQRSCNSDRKRTPNTHPAHHQNSMPKMRKQHRLRLASANQRRRRRLNPILQMHKMQPHIQRIHLNTGRLHSSLTATHSKPKYSRSLSTVLFCNP